MAEELPFMVSVDLQEFYAHWTTEAYRQHVVEFMEMTFELQKKAPLTPDLPRIDAHPLLEPAVRAITLLLFTQTEMFHEVERLDISKMRVSDILVYHGRLVKRKYFLSNREGLLRLFCQGIADIVAIVNKALPAVSTTGTSLVTVPNIHLLPSPVEAIDEMRGVLAHARYWHRGLFNELYEMLFDNAKLASGLDLEMSHGPEVYRMIQWPKDSKLPAEQMVRAYLKGSYLDDLLLVPFPVRYELEYRHAHTHIIGRTGSGKTTLMERMIMGDLLSPAPPSLVVLTPHGGLIKKLRNLAPPLSNRMLVIDPSDTGYPPAINPFSAPGRKVSPNTVIQTFDYILASLGLELTPKQRALWKPTIRMLVTLPATRSRNATILDIRDFMLDPDSYRDVIDQLPAEARKFFYGSVFPTMNAQGKLTKSVFDGTREEIGYRLADILSEPAISDMLSAQETKIDFYAELNKGSVILIDTAKKTLLDASSLFGGVMIALVFQAMLAREDIEEDDRRSTFFYIDEAANYFSDDMTDMLEELRKYHCGLILAHHEMEQARKKSGSLASSLLSQPTIRFAAPSAKDAAEVAREMRCTPNSLEELPENHFAMHIKGVTSHAVAMKVDILKPPMASDAQREAFKWRSRIKVSLGEWETPSSTPAPTPPSPSPQEPDDGTFYED